MFIYTIGLGVGMIIAFIAMLAKGYLHRQHADGQSVKALWDHAYLGGASVMMSGYLLDMGLELLAAGGVWIGAAVLLLWAIVAFGFGLWWYFDDVYQHRLIRIGYLMEWHVGKKNTAPIPYHWFKKWEADEQVKFQLQYYKSPWHRWALKRGLI